MKLAGADARLWDEECDFLLFVEARGTLSAAEWVAEHRPALRAALDRHAVVFLRGFADGSRCFEAMVDALASDPLSYVGGVTPRSAVHGSVFTATDAPPDLAIVQHHEMSYHRHTPRYLAFHCDTPPAEGGATPVTDGRRFAREMSRFAPRVMRDLEERGALFVRNYNDANMKGWRAAWETDDRSVAEAKLREANVTWRWLDDDWLHTRQVLPAIARAPASDARVLFSCLHLWHRSYVAKMNASSGLPLPDDPNRQPYATFFGDGEAIPDEFIAHMHATYESLAVAIPYRKDDVMIVNNLLATHGRQPFAPPRRVYVTMREKVELSGLPFCQPMKGGLPHECRA